VAWLGEVMIHKVSDHMTAHISVRPIRTNFTWSGTICAEGAMPLTQLKR
jgi:hypothetical protein